LECNITNKDKNAERNPLVGMGEIQDGKPKSEKKGHPFSEESEEVENSVDEANKDNGNDILDKLKTTIEKIKQMIGKGAEITRKEFSEWGQTLKDIVDGEKESETKDDIDYKKEEEKGSKDEEYGKEYGSDYLSWGRAAKPWQPSQHPNAAF
jgi:hypothetical protein